MGYVGDVSRGLILWCIFGICGLCGLTAFRFFLPCYILFLMVFSLVLRFFFPYRDVRHCYYFDGLSIVGQRVFS